MLKNLRARLAEIIAGSAYTQSTVAVRSGHVARDRLAVILAHQRTATESVDVLRNVDMKALQRDLLSCVKVRDEVQSLKLCFV